MKKIILILGANAVGKSTAAQALLAKLYRSAYIDADCCRARADHRDEVRIERGMKNTYSFYDAFRYPVIDTTCLSAEETADKILTDVLRAG